MTFDISSLAITDSTTVHLLHPATEEKLYADAEQKLPITITIASTASRQYRKAVAAMQNRRIQRGNKKETAERQKEEGIELLTACCISSDNLNYKGSAVKTEADFRALLSDDGMSWIKAQVDEALGNVELFIKQ